MNCAYALLLAASTLSAREAKTEFTFQEISPSALRLSDGGQPVFVYNFGMVLAPGFPKAMERSCYLHPVYGPDGTVLTDDFNPDHPHHRGISWMWPDVTVDGRNGDIWTVKNFKQRFVRWEARETTAETAKLAVENGWFDGERRFVKEHVEIVVHRVERPATVDARRTIDFTLVFDAIDRPVRIVGTSEGKKGFGGFCFRFAPATAARQRPPSTPRRARRPRTACWQSIAGPRWRASSMESRPGGASTTWKETPAIRTTAGCCDMDLDSSTCRGQG